MALFARALNELGAHVLERHGGSFLALARCGDGSAVRARGAAGEPADVARRLALRRRRVPFFKRAQLAAADLHLQGIAPAADLAALTLFADNLVPHVLRIDGVLEFDAALVARIDRGDADRARQPRGGRDPRLRAARGRAARRGARGHHRDRGRQRALAARRRAALQGPPAAPGADDGLLNAVAPPEVAEADRRGGVHRGAELGGRRPAVAVGERVVAQRGVEDRAGPCACAADRAGTRPRRRSPVAGRSAGRGSTPCRG